MRFHDELSSRIRLSEIYDSQQKVLVLFGTRPEVIKLAPIVHALHRRKIRTVVVSSSQHKQLLIPFLRMLDINVDFDLRVMRENQGPNGVCSRVLAKLDKVLETERPDMILVQGDTTTTLAGALAGFNRKIPVAHVEAGLRSGDFLSPFPEEMNRRIVSQVATLHFAATKTNASNLIEEGINNERIYITGNPVVDSLHNISRTNAPSKKISEILAKTGGKKRLLLTTHRRESFGKTMAGNLMVLRDFVKKQKDVCLLFPVHPNPNVRKATNQILANTERVYLLDPLNYHDFVALMKASWLIVSDSGGVQEEAPSLGKPLFILRENTERPEAIEAGVARLVGDNPNSLKLMLEQNYLDETWIQSVKEIGNPFGDGKAASRIVKVIEKRLKKKQHLTS